MTATGDVEGRLARGRPVVDDLEQYVRACQHVGYTHPDLTARAGQVHDWYATEDGLQLDALSSDADALAMVSQLTEHVARRQSGLVARLTAAWSGHGAGSALEFLARNQHAATTVGAAVREATQALSALRDELWDAVDAKVAATLAADAGQRAQWLAAARTVTSGDGDRSTASEVIDGQVKPFVHDVVGTQWVGAMRSHTAAVETAYRTALARLGAAGETLFEVPGQLGPRSPELDRPSEPAGSVESGEASGPTPGAWASPAPAAPASFASPPAPSPLGATELPAQQPLTTPSATPASTSPLGDLGSLGSGSSGLSGFGQQLSDLIGGLLGGAERTGADSLELEDADERDRPGREPGEEPEDESEEDAEDEPGEDGEDEAASTDGEPRHGATPDGATPDEGAPVPTDAVAADQGAPPPAATTAPVPAPPPTAPAPPSGAAEVTPPPPEPTPCEIAADELPQVGE